MIDREAQAVMEGLADSCSCPQCGRASLWFVQDGEKQAFCVATFDDCPVLRFRPDGTSKYIPTTQLEWDNWKHSPIPPD